MSEKLVEIKDLEISSVKEVRSLLRLKRQLLYQQGGFLSCGESGSGKQRLVVLLLV